MKKSIALVTDSASNLHPGSARELGIRVVPGSFAFDDEQVLDEPDAVSAMYSRMCSEQKPPRTFGPTEAAWTAAFLAGLEEAESVTCLVTPFDVTSSFTTASAAMLAIQFDRPDARIKIVNPGVGSAGLAALCMTLGSVAAAESSMEDLLATIDELEPKCDSIFVPGELTWMRHSGKLSLIEDRVGGLEEETPILRVGTRMTGLAKSETFEAALAECVQRVGQRPGSTTSLNVTIVHAAAAERATLVADLVRETYPVRELCITELAATIGAQLGPGTIGVGVAPAAAERRE